MAEWIYGSESFSSDLPWVWSRASHLYFPVRLP